MAAMEKIFDVGPPEMAKQFLVRTTSVLSMFFEDLVCSPSLDTLESHSILFCNKPHKESALKHTVITAYFSMDARIQNQRVNVRIEGV